MVQVDVQMDKTVVTFGGINFQRNWEFQGEFKCIMFYLTPYLVFSIAFHLNLDVYQNGGFLQMEQFEKTAEDG